MSDVHHLALVERSRQGVLTFTDHAGRVTPVAMTAMQRIGAVDWNIAAQELEQHGNVVLPSLLSVAECEEIAAMYSCRERFRSRVVMARHGYGRGEYQYFAYPLPALIDTLRTALYQALVPVANRWHDAMRIAGRFPERHADFLARCHAAGQVRPTPLLLRYGVDDYNCLHQDVYGELVFPIQAVVLLSAPGSDFGGGEFVMTSRLAGAPAAAEVVPLRQGDAALFAVRQRPLPGRYRARHAQSRHGVSQVLWGKRHTLGLIFHDAL